METNKVLIFGAGGHAKVVMDSLWAEQKSIVALIDQYKLGTLSGIPIFNAYDANFSKDSSFIVALGDNKARAHWVSQISHRFTTTIHPTALLAPDVQIGEGSMILHRAIVQVECRIGRHVILNTQSQIDHDCDIGDFVHIAPGSVICGRVTIGSGSLIGAGAVILPNVSIGEGAIVGAGSVVIRNVAPGSVVVGNPARVLTKW
jgi:sugar O-acyltransferase (sialic acid O-acetyltransferase NeuD family)